MTYARFSFASILFITISAFLAQFLIEFSSENLLATCIAFSSTLLIIAYMGWTRGLEDSPLSTFAIFGFCVTTQLGALVAQSASWTPLIKDLRQPITTFTVLALAQLIAICTHATHRIFSNKKTEHKSIARSLLTTLNTYQTPSAGVLWIMGAIGFSTFTLGYGGEGIFSKINQAVMFLAWAPFLIPIYTIQHGQIYCNARSNNIFLTLYMALFVTLGIAINARGIMLSGFITIALFATLYTIRSKQKVSQKLIAKIIVGFVLLGAISIPLTELATAMVIARKSRGTASPLKMIEDTIYYVQQPTVLKARRESDKADAKLSAYDETYIGNPIIARLVETKFHDNALYFSSTFSDKQKKDLSDKSIDLITSILPTPILNLLNIKINKEELQFSIGDYIAYLSIGSSLGSYKTGSLLAHGYALFDYYFIFIYAGLCLMMFKIMDLLTFKGEDDAIHISSLGLLGIWKFFQYGITAESLQHMLSNIFRYFPQNIIIYTLLMYISGKLIKTFSKNLYTKLNKNTPQQNRNI